MSKKKILVLLPLILAVVYLISYTDLLNVKQLTSIEHITINGFDITTNILDVDLNLPGPCFAKDTPNSYFYNFKSNPFNDFYVSMKNLSSRAESKLPELGLDMFQPVAQPHFKRKKKKTVIIGVGVHIGLPKDSGSTSFCADFEYISWERRHFPPMIKYFDSFLQQYNRESIVILQKALWNEFHAHNDMIRADIIMCGFDAWHCLAFAPFNKKLVINSAYRFEGHVEISPINVKHLQTDLYNSLRYNPDVINSGTIIYDVIYQKHFLGTDKMIPLHATCEYVLQDLKTELKEKRASCQGVPENTTGYHPSTNIVSIFPKRFSDGGQIIANEIIDFSRRVNGNLYKIESLPEILKRQGGKYDYCELGKFPAVINLGYSVMSYFTCEVAEMGIPMFVPTPRLYAEWERKYHLILERKSSLVQTTVKDMKENSRTLMPGLNPNDDFDIRAIQRWVAFSDYYYYGGVETFDSYEELFQKLHSANFDIMHRKMLQYRIRNSIRSQWNYRSMNKYFFLYEGDNSHLNPNDEGNLNSDAINPYMPKSYDEGMEMFKKKNQRMEFTLKTKTFVSKHVTIIPVRSIDIQTLCPAINDHVIFYFATEGSRETTENCIYINVVSQNEIPEIVRFRRLHLNFTQDSYAQLLSILMYVIRHGGHSIEILDKTVTKTCHLQSSHEPFIQFPELYSQFSFIKPETLWLAWIPIAGQSYADLWMKTVLNFTEITDTIRCLNIKKRKDLLPEFELSRLSDYLHHWKTDEVENFFHVLDQLTFELAVRGYTSKLYAELYREWLTVIANTVKSSVPKLIL